MACLNAVHAEIVDHRVCCTAHVLAQCRSVFSMPSSLCAVIFVCPADTGTLTPRKLSSAQPPSDDPETAARRPMQQLEPEEGDEDLGLGESEEAGDAPFKMPAGMPGVCWAVCLGTDCWFACVMCMLTCHAAMVVCCSYGHMRVG